ncbi:MAG TPA: hypothetical protein VGE52_07985 [Pirellulales bacterium]
MPTPDWDHADYLYHRILHWFYERGRKAAALPFVEPLEQLLDRLGDQHEPILAAGARSVIAEIRGDLPAAVEGRRREIELIEQVMLRRNREFGVILPEEISDRQEILARLLWQHGDRTGALQVLEQSREYCRRRNIPFAGEFLETRIQNEISGRGAKRRSKSGPTAI